ncbi:MAG: hypothetical protein V1752_04690 [Candidatus Firestonebacteria bacterium]
MDIYKHKQQGWGIIGIVVVVLVVALFCLVRFGCIGFDPLLAGVVTVILVGMLFAEMTVIIDGEYLKVSFSMNIINIKFRFDEITSCKVVKNPWYQPWGIHYGGGRWFYNVSGYDAVEITLKNGNVHIIGTNEPEKLEQAIRKTLVLNRETGHP